MKLLAINRYLYLPFSALFVPRHTLNTTRILSVKFLILIVLSVRRDPQVFSSIVELVAIAVIDFETDWRRH